MGDRAPARGARRDSLFLLTSLVAPDGASLGNARVRNLSATGMMADCERALAKGQQVSMELRGIGRVSGTVAWTQDTRVGVHFDEEVDPQLARRPVGQGATSNSKLPPYLRPAHLGTRR